MKSQAEIEQAFVGIEQARHDHGPATYGSIAIRAASFTLQWVLELLVANGIGQATSPEEFLEMLLIDV